MKLALCHLLFLFSASSALAAVRVALVANGGGEAANQTIALATAALSGSEGLELLDRQTIDTVLQEQKLNLSGLVDDDQKIQVGKMLKADLFAIVETDASGGQALGLVIFDTVTGLRLSDSAVGGKPEQAANAIAAAVRAAVDKDRSLNNGVRLIGFLPVRNADLPRDRDIFCDTVRLLLERQLTASPGIAVLERARLEQVNKERQLRTAQGGGDLWSSVIIVQLEISARPKGQGLSASAVLMGSSGQRLDKLDASIGGDSAADLADQLRDRLIQSLKAQAIDHPFDRVEEARRFARDSEVLVFNSRFAPGAAAGEAAYALDQGDRNRLTLSTALWARAWECLTPDKVNLVELQAEVSDPLNPSSDDLDQALGLASRALTLQQESLKAELASSHDGQFFMDYSGGEERITFLEGCCSRLNAVANVPPELQIRVKEFRSPAMAYVLDYYDGWGKTIEYHPADLKNYNAEMLYAMNVDASIATSFAEFTAVRDHLIHQWMQAFDKHWLPPKDLWMQGGERQSELMTELFEMGWVRTDRWKDFSLDTCHKSLGPIADDLNHSTYPVMRLYGAVATVLADPEFAATTAEAKTRMLRDFMRQFEETLDKPGPTPKRVRQYAYIAAVDAIHLLTEGTESNPGAMIDLLNLAARHKQLIPDTALYMILKGRRDEGIDFRSSGGPLRPWLTALKETLELSRSPDCHVLDGNADGVRQKLTAEIHTLHERLPELGPEEAARPWDSAKLLVDLGSLPGISQLESAFVSADRVFVLGTGTEETGGAFIQAFELTLGGGSPKPLARMPVTPLSNPYVDDHPDGFVFRLVQGAAADDLNFYASVRHQGVIAFALGGGAATRIDSTHGLPTNFAQSLVSERGSLYIASSAEDGAYLTKWNPKNRSAKVLISSLRRNKKSPLDDTPSLCIEMMADDRPRHRLLLGVAELGPDSNERWDSGLYQLDAATGKIEHLLNQSTLNFGQYIGIDHDSLFAANTIWVVQFDLDKNKGRYFSFKPGTIDPVYIQGMDLDPDTVKGSGWSEPDNAREGDRKVIDGWLWIGQPFSRVSADAKSIEMLSPKVDPNNPPLGSIWIIEPAGKNQVVLGDSNQLYLLSLHQQ
ncbi:MAG: hypothetical protein ABSB42_18970 [Tepidisphaeraceae bacterium]